MGCDIHASIEFKESDYWDVWAEGLWFPRNYLCFALMAGVRNYHEPVVVPISEPRGLPENVSNTVAIRSREYGADGHSHSWLSVDEMVRMEREYAEMFVRRWPNETTVKPELTGPWKATIEAMKALGESRIVFWFDN